MKCSFCLRGFTRSEESRRVEERRQPDMSVKAFSDAIPGARLSQASGPLTAVLHNKCWYARESRRNLAAAREADLSAQTDRVTDYRDQETVEVGQISEGHPDHRGA
jgi:hypothetical protein